jgi:CheY-like chemotaxis protein/HPt (histidine-containing phosphotransfer) domain-containing protein
VPLDLQKGRETVVFSEISPQTGVIPLAPFRLAAGLPAPAENPVNPDATILLVDDNAEIRMTVLAMLKRLGFEAQAVNDGQQAVEAAASRSWQMILMDCQMPVLDGFEATRRIRQVEKEAVGGRNGLLAVPIVAMTAGALAGDREKCLAFGMDDYLGKPFTMDTLKDLLHRFLGDEAAPAIRQSEKQGSTAKLAARSAAPAIDYDALHRINSLGSGPSNDLLSRVVRSYLDAAPPIIDVLRLAVEGGDSDAISAAAHRLKGSSAQLGVDRVAELCADLEQMGGESDNGAADAKAALLRELEQEFGRARTALEEECLRIAS